MRAAVARRASGPRSCSSDDPASQDGPAPSDSLVQPTGAPGRGAIKRAQPASRPQQALPASAPAPSVAPDDLEPVGRVADSYGVDGRLKIQPFGSIDDSVLLRCEQWWVSAAPAGAAPAASVGGAPVPWRVERARVHGSLVLAKVAGIRDREAALRWRGAQVLVSRARFPAPLDDEYYWVDLVGCQVVNREGATLGQVAAVDDHGAHALLRIQPPQGRAFLMPFVEAYVDRVDLAARRIEVDWQPDYL